MEIYSPQISVIVPVYNVKQYLHKCIDSILSQTFTNFELLLIDDGSSDDSGSICDEYAKLDLRIQVFHKKNGGVSAARNLGIDKAIGEWICFVDSDDWIEKETFLEIIDNIEEKKIDLVIWGYRLVYPNYSNEINVPISGCSNNKTAIDELLIMCDFQKLLESPCNKLYYTKIIKERMLKFDTNLSLMEDSKFNWNYFNSVQSIYSIKKTYYNYRINHNRESLSARHIDNLIEIRTENVAKRLNFFVNYDGKYKNQYLSFLEKDIEMAHLELILALYASNASLKQRSENIRNLIGRGKIDSLNGGFIYKLLKTQNVFFIDTILKSRYLTNRSIPYLFGLFQKLRTKYVKQLSCF